MKSPINKKHRFYIVSSLVLLAICFSPDSSFGQIPGLFLKFVEKQNNVKSGYVKLQRTDITGTDTLIRMQEGFFISTPKDLKYLLCEQRPKHPHLSRTPCKLANSIVCIASNTMSNYSQYGLDDEVYNAKDLNDFLYLTAKGMSVNDWENHIFQRIPPKINKKNIRYKIVYPDQEQDLLTNISREFEFDRKTFIWIQEELSLTYDKIEQMYHRVDIFEQRLYDYIHPDILDTVTFKYEELKKGYDQQCAVEQAKKDSVFRDSIVSLVAHNGGIWTQESLEEKDTVFFMPEWKFPSLSGDTIYSDSIKSRFLFIDLWYVGCHPCRMAMRELASIDTLYDESLLKMISINVFDTDTAKMNRVVKNLNLRSEVACAFNSDAIFEMSKEMGEPSRGYPQLYLIDMETRQVIWYSRGWGKGFTKEIGEIITDKKER